MSEPKDTFVESETGGTGQGMAFDLGSDPAALGDLFAAKAPILSYNDAEEEIANLEEAQRFGKAISIVPGQDGRVYEMRRNDMRAKFSRTDDRDERANRVYIVGGRLDKYCPDVAARICNGGNFLPIAPETVLEPRYVEDEEALTQLIMPEVRSYVKVLGEKHLEVTGEELVILIGAVDNNPSRQFCHRVFQKAREFIYIDSGSGNGEYTGQVVCGVRRGGRTISRPVGRSTVRRTAFSTKIVNLRPMLQKSNGNGDVQIKTTNPAAAQIGKENAA